MKLRWHQGGSWLTWQSIFDQYSHGLLNNYDTVPHKTLSLTRTAQYCCMTELDFQTASNQAERRPRRRWRTLQQSPPSPLHTCSVLRTTESLSCWRKCIWRSSQQKYDSKYTTVNINLFTHVTIEGSAYNTLSVSSHRVPFLILSSLPRCCDVLHHLSETQCCTVVGLIPHHCAVI